MTTNSHNIDASRQLFYDNIEFLFKLNKEKNFLKKSDFFRETNISRQSLPRWKQGSIPARTTLNRIVEYFNRWLYLDLTPEQLLNENLQQVIKLRQTAPSAGLSPEEQSLLQGFRKLKQEDKKLLLKLIKRLGRS